MDMLFLLSDQQRPTLQDDESDVDRVNDGRHCEHDDPPALVGVISARFVVVKSMILRRY
jgi:hypothetical protein